MEMPLLLLLIPVSAIFVIIMFLAMVFEKSLEDRLHAIRSIYIYTVSFISLCVFLFGLGMLVYTGMSFTFFPKALEQNYSYRLMNCEYPVKAESASGATLTTTAEEKARCEEREKEAIENDKEIYFQSSMLSGIILILVALPIYVIHFFFLRKKGE